MIDSDRISTVWFRRSFDWDVEERFWDEPTSINEYKFLRELNNYHQTELRTVYNLIEEVLTDRYWLNRPSKSSSKKFKTLALAKQLGFEVPNTLITNHLSGLKEFVIKHPRCITKANREGSLLIGADFGVSTMTNRVDSDTIKSFSKDFFTPSLFQQEIEKEYEIRVIYLENEIFATGIFSQKNEKTEVDYRNYDHKNPNRLQLIELPNMIIQRVRNLMNTLQLNFGSMDIIKDRYEKYYFLEVNPVGQFLGISDILGLAIEKKIAKILIDKNESQKV